MSRVTNIMLTHDLGENEERIKSEINDFRPYDDDVAALVLALSGLLLRKA